MNKGFALLLAGIIGFSTIGCTESKNLKEIFTQKREIMGIKFYATKGVPDNKLQHAMNVMAEYLDNDRDGYVIFKTITDSLFYQIYFKYDRIKMMNN